MPKKDFQLPEEGEVVLATVTEITPYGAYVTLDEYGGIHGFLHVSEISSGWVKHIDRYVKENQKIILKVIRVDKVRREVDLSLRQLTEEERRNKLILIKKEEKSRSVLKKVALDLQIPEQILQSYIEKILEEYTSLYSMIDVLLQRGPSILTKISLPEDFSQKVYEVAKEKLSPPPVVVNEIIQITSTAPNGLDIIKQVLGSAIILKNENNISVSIKYVGAPNYRLSLSAPNYKIAEHFLKQVNDLLQKEAKKNRCELQIKRV